MRHTKTSHTRTHTHTYVNIANRELNFYLIGDLCFWSLEKNINRWESYKRTHTHTCTDCIHASHLAEFGPNTCYSKREPSIMAVTRQTQQQSVRQHLNQSGGSVCVVYLRGSRGACLVALNLGTC